MRIRFPVLLLALFLPACGASENEHLPPLARVSVPTVEHRAVPASRPMPATLSGQTELAVRDYLGEPDLVRREPPAQIWRYGDENCGVHLFFYEDGGEMRVAHMETRLPEDSTLSPAACLDRLRLRAIEAGA